MRKGRFSEEQIINVLKEHQAGIPVAESCRKHGISGSAPQRRSVIRRPSLQADAFGGYAKLYEAGPQPGPVAEGGPDQS